MAMLHYATMAPVISIRDLKKTYDDGVEALSGIDLDIAEGGFFGLLGPNGAGKSTTIGIICSLINKSAGSVQVCGYDIDSHTAESKLQLGIVPQEFNFNIFEPCYQIVCNSAGYYGMPWPRALERCKVLFEGLGLMEKWNTPAGQLSGGMKRRLMIARGLVHEPRVLILDEPTAGVDISLRRSMWSFLEEENKKGLSIILTTHYLEEAEHLCKRIAIIDKGRIIENAPTSEILDKLNSETLVLYSHELRAVPEISELSLSLVEPGVLEVEISKDYSITRLMQQLAEKGVTVNRFRNKANRLEEMFVKLVGND